MMPDDRRGKTVSRHAAVQTLCAEFNRRSELQLDAQRLSLVALDRADQGAFAGGTWTEEPDRPLDHAFAAAATLTSRPWRQAAEQRLNGSGGGQGDEKATALVVCFGGDLAGGAAGESAGERETEAGAAGAVTRASGGSADPRFEDRFPLVR